MGLWYKVITVESYTYWGMSLESFFTYCCCCFTIWTTVGTINTNTAVIRTPRNVGLLQSCKLLHSIWCFTVASTQKNKWFFCSLGSQSASVHCRVPNLFSRGHRDQPKMAFSTIYASQFTLMVCFYWTPWIFLTLPPESYWGANLF